MENMNVLIFPAGSEIAIEVYDALKLEKNITLFGATSVLDHSEFLYRNLRTDIPFFDAPDFINVMNALVDEWNIDFIYPARDDVQLFLIQNEGRLHARVVSSPAETTRICRSKQLTYEHFAGCPFVPRVFMPQEIIEFPVFGKPAVSEGAKGALLVCDERDLEACLSTGEEYVFCEYLPGTEYTVDCLTDADSELKCCIPRVRERVRSGISVRARTVEDDGRFRKIAKAINTGLIFVGAWFFQVKERANGELVLMEASPRVPGTMGLTRNLGINYPLLTLYALRGMPFEVCPNNIPATLDKAFISRFGLGIEYDTVYIDYDDTLVVRGEVNAQAMQFLYQCRNKGKHVILLTRHDGDLWEDLQAHWIPEGLFDEVKHLGRRASKADCVNDSSAIFIDDSFREREAVRRFCGIPVFEPGNIEALLDWRM